MENDMKNELILYCKNNKQIRLPADPENINALQWIKNNSIIYKSVPGKTVVDEQFKLFMPNITKKRGREIFELSEKYIADREEFNEKIDELPFYKKLKFINGTEYLQLEPLSHHVALKIAEIITHKSFLRLGLETNFLTTELKSLHSTELLKEIIVKHAVLTHLITPDRAVELDECFSPRFSSGCSYVLGCATENTDKDHTVLVWGWKDGKCVGRKLQHEDSISSLAYNEMAEKCIIGGGRGSLGFYSGAAQEEEDWKSQEIVSTHSQAEIWGCELSKDGSLAVSSGEDYTLRVWDTNTQKELWSDKINISGKINILDLLRNSGFTACAFSQDDTLLLVGHNNGNASVYESKTGKRLLAMEGHKEAVGAIAISSDQRKYATGSEDKTARLWDSRDGRCISILGLHTDGVSHVAFSQDDRYVATGGEDNKVCLWHADEGKFIFTIETHESDIKDVKFLPNELLLCTVERETDNPLVTTYDIEKLIQKIKIDVPSSSVEDLLLLIAELREYTEPKNWKSREIYTLLRTQYQKLASGKDE